MWTYCNIVDGMFTGRKIFFYNVKKNYLKEKISRILLRLEAEIVEQYLGKSVNIVIIDEDSKNTNALKRKGSPKNFVQIKRPRLMNYIKNNYSSNSINSVSNNSDFISHVRSQGSKIKTLNEIWEWLNEHYKYVIENCEPEDVICRNPSVDKANNVKFLECPSLKILDVFGGMKPQIVEQYHIQKSLWFEFTKGVSNEVIGEMNRVNTGITKRKRKSVIGDEYCENCKEIYKCAYQHLQSDKHKTFAENLSNFAGIDQIIGTDTLDVFFENRNRLCIKWKQAKAPLHNLPRIMKQISIKETNFVDDFSSSVVVNEKNLIEKSIASSSSYTTSDSSFSSNSSDSSSCTSQSVASSHEPSNHQNCIASSTPLSKAKKPTLFSPESISADDNQQSQISQQVDSIIGNLSSHLYPATDFTKNSFEIIDLDMSDCPVNQEVTHPVALDSLPKISPHQFVIEIDSDESMLIESEVTSRELNRPIESNLKDQVVSKLVSSPQPSHRLNNPVNCNPVPRNGEENFQSLRKTSVGKLSPILSRRFDWCENCNRNHKPVLVDNHECKFSPIKMSQGLSNNKITREPSDHSDETVDVQSDATCDSPLSLNRRITRLNVNTEFEVENCEFDKENARPAIKRATKHARRSLAPLENIDYSNSKRAAALSANRGIVNCNRFFQTNIKNTIKTIQDSCDPFVYNPRILINKMNYLPNSPKLSK